MMRVLDHRVGLINVTNEIHRTYNKGFAKSVRFLGLAGWTLVLWRDMNWKFMGDSAGL